MEKIRVAVPLERRKLGSTGLDLTADTFFMDTFFM